MEFHQNPAQQFLNFPTMFKRDEAGRLRQQFWTTFGKYMNPVPSAEGLRINWINYHTGVKHIYFRMDASGTSAQISISLEHPDAAQRAHYFKQFQQLETILHTELQEPWHWYPEVITDDKAISAISKILPSVSVFNQAQWPDLITFFKPRIMALDRFWQNARYSLDSSDT